MLEKVMEATKLFSKFNASAINLGNIIFKEPAYHQRTRARFELGQNTILVTMKCVAEKLERMLTEFNSHLELIQHKTFVPEMYGLYSFLVNAMSALIKEGAPVKIDVALAIKEGHQEFEILLQANMPHNRN